MLRRSVLELMVLVLVLGTCYCPDPDNNTKPRPVPSQDFTHSAQLDELGKYYLYWSFDSQNITFEVHARTAGWVGFGLTDNGRMAGADVVVGWIKDGNTYFKDRYAHANSRPSVDTKQNYELLYSEENEDFTVLTFTRKLQTCDSQDFQLHNGTVRVIYAWSHLEPDDSESFLYHGATQRGTQSLVLLGGDNNPGMDLDGLQTFDLLQDQVNLPSNRTYYNCRVMEAPKLDKKHHVIRYEPVIEADNSMIVHHMLIFECSGEKEVDIESYDCLAMFGIPGLSCRSMIYAWAIGGVAFNLPDEAGMPFGANGDVTYYLIQTHYDNPEGLTGVTDSSGMRMYYTDTLRQNDAGILVLGSTINEQPIVIPPKTNRMRLDTYCGKTCTQEQIPEDGINVYGTTLHTHIYGTGVKTRQFRGGEELAPLAEDNYYDFNYQTMISVQPSRKVMPGDELLTTCTYNTSKTDKVVMGGAGSDDEMCLVFVAYYPRIPLQSCLSNVLDLDVIYNLVKTQAADYVFGPDHIDPPKEHTYFYLPYVSWDSRSRRYLQDQIDNVQEYDSYCVLDGEPTFGFVFNSSKELIRETRIDIQKPYVGANYSCPVDPDQDKPGPVPTEEYPHKAELDEMENYFLYWKFDSERITFEVHVRTTGWFGFGLSNNGAMKGADIVVGWINDGTTYFKDRHGVGNVRPVVDEKQNYDLHQSMERDEFTIFQFSRKLQTCDEHDYQLDSGTVSVMFAWNDMKPVGEDFLYHGRNRGVRSIVLLDSLDRSKTSIEGLMSFDLRHNKARIPEERTYYHCSIIEPPQLNEKHHVIRIKPLIEPHNKGVVHHILLYQCFGEKTTDLVSYTCGGGRGGGMPVEDGLNCESLIYAWAIGQEDYNFPAEAGISLGSSYDPDYYMMETHYDNPQLLEGIVDSSGISMQYTSELRQHDVGLLTLGNTISWPPMILPPGMENLRVNTFCSSSCTKEQIPEDGINLFAAFLHTHNYGTQVMTSIVHDGEERAPIAQDLHFDFNYQAIRAFPEQVLLEQGDELVTSCVYDTSAKTSMVLSGPGTDDEMCLVFVMYYPRIPLSSCLSHIQNEEFIYKLVNKQAEGGAFGPSFTLKPTREMYDYLFIMQWNDESRKDVQDAFDNVQQYDGYCALHDQPAFGGVEPTKETKMVVTKLYQPMNVCRVNDTKTSGSRGTHEGHVTVMAAICALLLFSN